MCYLGDEEEKAMFLVVSRSDVHFGFDQPFFLGKKIIWRKIGRLERNLSTPAEAGNWGTQFLISQRIY